LQNENVNFLPKIHYLACMCEAPCTSESCLWQQAWTGMPKRTGQNLIVSLRVGKLVATPFYRYVASSRRN